MTLLEDDPAVVGVYYTWALSGAIVDRRYKDDLDMITLVGLWIFSDKIICPELQTNVMDRLINAFCPNEM